MQRVEFLAGHIVDTQLSSLPLDLLEKRNSSLLPSNLGLEGNQPIGKFRFSQNPSNTKSRVGLAHRMAWMLNTNKKPRTDVISLASSLQFRRRRLPGDRDHLAEWVTARGWRLPTPCIWPSGFLRCLSARKGGNGVFFGLLLTWEEGLVDN